jgi:hypothetical protein
MGHFLSNALQKSGNLNGVHLVKLVKEAKNEKSAILLPGGQCVKSTTECRQCDQERSCERADHTDGYYMDRGSSNPLN